MGVSWSESSYEGYHYWGKHSSADYQGYVVQTNSSADGRDETWYAYRWNPVAEEHEWSGEAVSLAGIQTVLESLVQGRRFLCEVYQSKTEGHCTGWGFVVAHTEARGEKVRLVLCEGHSRHVFTHWDRTPVLEYADTYGLTPDEPINSGRIQPEPDTVIKRGHYLAKPAIWGDDYGPHYAAMTPALEVRPGSLIVFRNDHGNAYRVKSIDEIPMPDGQVLLRFNCEGGATAGAYRDSIVSVLRETPF